jgi:hypothetical protein
VSAIGLLLVLLSAIAKAVMDVIQFKYYDSIFKEGNSYFWNPTLSWYNKYKNLDPKQGPKFFLSTTVLVWTTDAWHLFQMIFLNALVVGHVILTLGVSSWWVLWSNLIAVIGFRVVFEIFYSKVFIKKNRR